MTEVTVALPDDLAQEIARRAAALGTTAADWMAAVLRDVAADLPETTEDGPDAFIAR
jgi:hypothetical protein